MMIDWDIQTLNMFGFQPWGAGGCQSVASPGAFRSVVSALANGLNGLQFCWLIDQHCRTVYLRRERSAQTETLRPLRFFLKVPLHKLSQLLKSKRSVFALEARFINQASQSQDSSNGRCSQHPNLWHFSNSEFPIWRFFGFKRHDRRSQERKTTTDAIVGSCLIIPYSH